MESKCNYPVVRWLSSLFVLVFSTLLNFTAHANPLVVQCRTALFQQPETAKAICLPLLMEPEERITKEDNAKIYMDLASRYIIDGNFDEAETLLNEAQVRNLILGENNVYRYNWLRMKGSTRFRQGKLSEALPFMQEALSIAQILERESSIATSLNDVGAIQMQLGNYQQALMTFQEGLKVLENLERPHSQALSLANIGIIYRDLYDFELAVTYFERSKTKNLEVLAQKPEDSYLTREYGHVLEELGNTYFLLGKLALARQNLDNALQIFVQGDFAMERARVLIAQARMARSQENTDQASSLINSADKILQDMTSSHAIAPEFQLEKAYILAELNQDQQALKAVTQGLQLESQTPHVKHRLELLQLGAKLHRRLGTTSMAIELLDRYTREYEVYLEEKYQPETSNLLSLIEVQQQRREIETLKKIRNIAQLKMAYQRWIIVSGIVVILVLTILMVMIYRQKLQLAMSLSREQKFHTAELERLSRQDNANP